jgi:hypothetical protein
VDNAETSELMVSDFFKVLYTEDPDVNPNQLLALSEHKVKEYKKRPLCREFTDGKLHNDLFQIGPIKTPEPSSEIFQRKWDTLRDDAINAVK